MKKNIWIAIGVLCLLAMALQPSMIKAQPEEKPIIVCTTHVLGSIVNNFVGDTASVTILVQPGICPAFYDIKPGDIYAVSKAKLIFYHGFEYKMWLKDMVATSGNEAVIMVKIPGDWNTPDGAKRYIAWVGGNLSLYLGVDLTPKITSMIASVDSTAQNLKRKAEEYDVSAVKVVCMAWQKPLVKWLGFDVVAEYGPPESLSASDIASITKTAREEGAMLVIDNLQSGVEFGANLASEIGAVHVVLTNFPGAIPKTESLVEMLEYNAKQLFDGVTMYKSTQALRSEIHTLKDHLTIFEVATVVLAILLGVETIVIVNIRKRAKEQGARNR